MSETGRDPILFTQRIPRGRDPILFTQSRDGGNLEENGHFLQRKRYALSLLDKKKAYIEEISRCAA